MADNEEQPQQEEQKDNSNNRNFLDNENGIDVQVTEPTVNKGLKDFVTYKIVGSDKQGSFQIVRRYSDIDHFRDAIVNKWPAVFIPPLPPKQMTGGTDPQFVEDRRRHLENFLKRLAKKQYLWDSEEINVLIRGQGDVEKQLKKLPVQSQDGLINKYQESFSELGEKEINTDIIVKISTFQQFLKKIQSNLINFRTMADNMSEVQKKHNEMFKTFFNFMLPEYEKNCLNEYTNGNAERNVFSNIDNQKFSESIENMKEFTERQEMVAFLDVIRMEQSEIEAFIDCYKKRDEYEGRKVKFNSNLKDLQIEMQKIMAGKGGNLFSKKPKEQMIEETQTKIDNCQKDNDQINFLCDVMTLILGYNEIDEFKKEKTAVYYQVLKQLAVFETEFAKAKIDMWGCVLENQNMPNF